MYRYTVDDTGYHIYSTDDPSFHIHQYEPYIPDHSKTYEENAKAQIEQLEALPSEPVFNLTESDYTSLRSDVDYLMLLNDPDSTSETVTE